MSRDRLLGLISLNLIITFLQVDWYTTTRHYFFDDDNRSVWSAFSREQDDNSDRSLERPRRTCLSSLKDVWDAIWICLGVKSADGPD